jgi:predicted DNA-binding transcriptional regulator AlpA
MKPRAPSPEAEVGDRIAAILERAASEIRALVEPSRNGLALLRDDSAHGEPAAANVVALAVPKLLTPNDLASRLQIDTRTLRRLRDAGEAPPEIQIGSLPRWRHEDVQHWIDERQPR